MKKILITLLLIGAVTIFETKAQVTFPDLSRFAIIPYQLDIGYNTTTVLIFPAPLIDATDRGSKDIITQKEAKVENILKVKAARKDFQPTNLHAYTTDGKVYVFNIRYVEYPSQTTFPVQDNFKNEARSLIMREDVINENRLVQLAEQIKHSDKFFFRKKIRYDMKLQLQTIHSSENILLFGFVAANSSNLDFNVDFIRLYIRDKQKVKRSSMQEQEIIPVYKDTLQKIPGQGEKRFVITIPQFTIPDNKEFFVELYEKNGGRHLMLKIKNRHLLRARKI